MLNIIPRVKKSGGLFSSSEIPSYKASCSKFYPLLVACEADPALLRVNRRRKESKGIPPHVG